MIITNLCSECEYECAMFCCNMSIFAVLEDVSVSDCISLELFKQ